MHIPNWFELQNTIEKCTISKRFELWNIMIPLSILIWYSLNVGLTPPPYRKPYCYHPLSQGLDLGYEIYRTTIYPSQYSNIFHYDDRTSIPGVRIHPG